MYISYLFSDNSEQAILKGLATDDEEIRLPKQPLGTWAVDILNADFQSLAEILESCKDTSEPPPYSAARFSAPGLWRCDFSKLAAVAPAIKNILGSVYPLCCSGHAFQSWHDMTFEFANSLPNGELSSVADTNSFKLFLDELLEKPEYFSFDFLNFLNTSGEMRPFFIPPCISFTPQADDKENNSEQKPLDELYNAFLHRKDTAETIYQYDFASGVTLVPLLIASLLELTRQGKIIRKCANCGKYFVPENRKDTIYCNNQSPQDSARSCKQYGSDRLWYERQKDDEIATLSRNILSSKSMLAKRSNNYRPYIISYDYFRTERLKWKKAVANGEKTEEEYREWLLKMKSQKIIEEAMHGND